MREVGEDRCNARSGRYFALVRAVPAILLLACAGSASLQQVPDRAFVHQGVPRDTIRTDEFRALDRVSAAWWSSAGAMNADPIVRTGDTLVLHALLAPGTGLCGALMYTADANWIASDSGAVALAFVDTLPRTDVERGACWRHGSVTIAANSGASGNRVVVLRDVATDKVRLIRRCVFVEDLAHIELAPSNALPASDRPHVQAVDITAHCPMLPIGDPFTEVEVVLLKDHLWEGALHARPELMNANEIRFPRPTARFEGGNEWRTIDLTDPREGIGGVERIDPGGELPVITLVPDERRSSQRYNEREDLNGAFVPSARERCTPLVAVNWRLMLDAPIAEGKVYVIGGFSDGRCLEEYRCLWDEEDRSYRALGLVPRGRVDYAYAVVHDGSPIPDLAFVEGSHARTENDVLALLYWKDRCIGAAVRNTRRHATFIVPQDR